MNVGSTLKWVTNPANTGFKCYSGGTNRRTWVQFYLQSTLAASSNKGATLWKTKFLKIIFFENNIKMGGQRTKPSVIS